MYYNWENFKATNLNFEGRNIDTCLNQIKQKYADLIEEITHEGYIDSTDIQQKAIQLVSGQASKIKIKLKDNWALYSCLKVSSGTDRSKTTSCYFIKENGIFTILPSGGSQGSVSNWFYFDDIGIAQDWESGSVYRDKDLSIIQDPYFLVNKSTNNYNKIQSSLINKNHWTKDDNLQWNYNELMHDSSCLNLYGFIENTYDGFQILSHPVKFLIPYSNKSNKPMNPPTQGFGTSQDGVYKYFNHYKGIYPDFVNYIQNGNPNNPTYQIIFKEKTMRIKTTGDSGSDYCWNPDKDIMICFFQTEGVWECTKGIDKDSLSQTGNSVSLDKKQIEGKLTFQPPSAILIESDIEFTNKTCNLFTWKNFMQNILFNINQDSILFNPTLESTKNIVRSFSWAGEEATYTDNFGMFNTNYATAKINSSKIDLKINFINWLEDYFTKNMNLTMLNASSWTCSVEGKGANSVDIKYAFQFDDTLSFSDYGIFPSNIKIIQSELEGKYEEEKSNALSGYYRKDTYEWKSFNYSQDIEIQNRKWNYQFWYYYNNYVATQHGTINDQYNIYVNADISTDYIANYYYLKPVIYHNLKSYATYNTVSSTATITGSSSQGAGYRFDFNLSNKQKEILKSDEYEKVGCFYSPDYSIIGGIGSINWDPITGSLYVSANNCLKEAVLEYHFYYWKKDLPL